MRPAIGLRDEQDADEAFVADLYAGGRAAEMACVPWSEAEKSRFLRAQFELQRTHYRTRYDNPAFSIVLADGVPVGRLYVQRGPAGIVLMDITLLAHWRGRGIGGALLRSLLEEAASSGQRVILHAERHNPARRLYHRLGFRPVATVGLHDRLEWSAGLPPAQSRQAEQPR